jgi:NlpC/P60 family
VSTITQRAVSVASSTRLKRLAFLKLARSQLGVPYVWGGASTTGFDCSGLVKWAAAKAFGVDLPHYTVDQWNQLPEVTSPLAGDLVYFYVPSDGPASSQPGHVGICANAGCSTMINAPAPGGVVDEVPTNPAGWGTIMGYRSVVGGGDAGPVGPTGPVGPGGQTGSGVGATGTKQGGGATSAVGCNAKGNVFGEGGLPIIHTGSFSFTHCEAKALIGGLCLAGGAFLMLTGGVLLAVYGLQKAGLAPTPSEVKGAVVGAAAGIPAGPAGIAAGAASGAQSGHKAQRSKVYGKVKARYSRDQDDAAFERQRNDDAREGRTAREKRGREAMRGTVREGAPRSTPTQDRQRRERQQRRPRTTEPADF